MRPLIITALVALTISIGSQVLISSTPLAGEGYDGLGRTAWVTILVTLPTFALAIGCLCAAGFVWFTTRPKNK
ncbi:MAG TPA: hypothetical protein VK983_02540 [Candidatus Limnocylindrales bacterium]|nr:hypothetical protein [Candidatus Limnocylindrales bacterium]